MTCPLNSNPNWVNGIWTCTRVINYHSLYSVQTKPCSKGRGSIIFVTVPIKTCSIYSFLQAKQIPRFDCSWWRLTWDPGPLLMTPSKIWFHQSISPRLSTIIRVITGNLDPSDPISPLWPLTLRVRFGLWPDCHYCTMVCTNQVSQHCEIQAVWALYTSREYRGGYLTMLPL